MGFLELAVLLSWAAVLAIAWLGYQLLVSYGRLLLRLEGLERHLGALEGLTPSPLDEPGFGGYPGDDRSAPFGLEPRMPFGVPVGTVLHEFELPDLDGRQHLRSEWLGERMLLTFINPHCRHSRRLLADLGPLLAHPAPTRPRVVLVSTGNVEENRRLVTTFSLADRVLMQEEMEVGALFEVDRTPTAYLVDEDGRTASPLVAGAVAILGLAANSCFQEGMQPVVEAPSPQLIEAATSTAPVNGARFLRGGLDVGDVAPDFRLPGLDGSEVALGRYRGRRVLLVFTDPVRPPCDRVISALEQVHLEARGPAMVIIARGGVDANRTWAERLGLTLPIGLQTHWDLSREYGILATPIAFLLDERGAVAAPVALGEDAILELARQPSTHPQLA